MTSGGASAAARRIAALAGQVEKYTALSAKPKPLRLVYSTTPSWPFASAVRDTSAQTDIGVLDSSFNPPHLAHHALASLPKPRLRDEKSSSGKDHFDAVLLLFSVRNADKGTGSNADASAAQRLYMMELVATDLARTKGTEVAVGLVEEPLMISKSTLLHRYVEEEHTAASPVRLHWLVGFDTLLRFFQVKYYPSPDFFAQACRTFFEQERTTFICARRAIDVNPKDNKQDEEEQTLLESTHVKPWVERGSVVMVDLEPSVQDVSSTAIRTAIGGKSQVGDLREKLQTLTLPSVADYLSEEGVYRN